MVINLENTKKIIVLIAITLLYLFVKTLPTIKVPAYNYATPNPTDTIGTTWTGNTWVTPDGKSWNWDKNIWE